MARVALLAHGAGSCPETAARLLGPLVEADVRAVAVDARGSAADVVRRLHEAADGHEVVVAAGVSLGAHAVATWAVTGGATRSLALVMPAWTGVPDGVAGLTAASAESVRRQGRAGVLAGIEREAPGDWVLDELRRGWATYTDVELADTLLAAAASPAPSTDELARITVPVAVVALDDDPLHPVEVARGWAQAVPDAQLVVVPRHAPLTDRGALGEAARRSLRSRTQRRP